MTTQIRALVVDDDPDVLDYLGVVLNQRGSMRVTTAMDARTALEHFRRQEFDVVLADIELPDMNGLELAAIIREHIPRQPVLVMTAHASVDYAMTAMRHQVDEFLFKPIRPAQLIASVTEAAMNGRRRRATTSGQVVLAIGAHPDDIEIGIGGLLAAHRAAGDAVVLLTASHGPRDRADEATRRALASAELLGARLYLNDLPDTAVSPADPTVAVIGKVVEEVSPTIVYTHSLHDRHQDHRAVHHATLNAASDIRTIACYQSPSATVDFRPTRFISVDGFTDTKLALLACYADPVSPGLAAGASTGIVPPPPEYLDPEYVLTTARYWARFGDGRTCEPLEVLRDQTGLLGTTGPVHETFTPEDRHDPQWVA
ncbi:response regulator [Nakamurella leprariae]|uniref:Response regulator n=1 Tax=Nakamurella leprariae TaxID=2803911 RepID=A0A938Y901_9ACTN|nr:response regulator [Nakamurella leprariae]MBM9468045.1 response regulator [Nakamurella leprariae]